MATHVPAAEAQPQQKTLWRQLTWWILILPAAMGVALAIHSVYLIDYTHVMSGILWTGADLFLGFILGPVMRRLTPPQRSAVINYLVPRTMLYMPIVAATTATAGWFMAGWLGFLAPQNPQHLWAYAALTVTALLGIQGLGVILPNNLRIYKELQNDAPNIDRVVHLNRINLRLSGIQGLLQVIIIVIMVHLVIG